MLGGKTKQKQKQLDPSLPDAAEVDDTATPVTQPPHTLHGTGTLRTRYVDTGGRLVHLVYLGQVTERDHLVSNGPQLVATEQICWVRETTDTSAGNIRRLID